MSDERDEQLRHSLLSAARLIGARMTDRWVGASMLADAARDGVGGRIENDGRATDLLGDLVSFGLLEEEQSPHLQSGPRSLRHRRFRLTRKAWALWMGDLPPLPGVYDPRMEV